MASDDERRRVAERLRELARDVDDVSDFDLARAVGLEATSRLIEPSEPKVKCVAEVKVDGERLEELVHDAAVELTGIDRAALLRLADELDENAELIIRAARNSRLTGCGPTMKEAKHDAGEWRHIARRIRAACVEVVA